MGARNAKFVAKSFGGAVADLKKMLLKDWREICREGIVRGAATNPTAADKIMEEVCYDSVLFFAQEIVFR